MGEAWKGKDFLLPTQRKKVKLNREGQSAPREGMHQGKGALGMVGDFIASLFTACSRLGRKTYLREMQNEAYGKRIGTEAKILQ